MVGEDPFAGLEPAPIWQRFAELTRIARPSNGESAAIEHVLGWASERGYATRQDERGNILVVVPASQGREAAPMVILQAHLDMVCERDPASEYDAAAGRIHVIREGDWIIADETTLGADDGIGVAAMLAVGDDTALAHGPLELLFTVTEELGLEGALALDSSLLEGRILLNLDSEEDGELTIGCAGSTTSRLVVGAPREPLPAGAVTLSVVLSGGVGGHSGMEIHLGRANAITALAHILGGASGACEFRLAALEGGRSRNAIPREAHATMLVEPGAEATLRRELENAFAGVRAMHRGADDGLRLDVAPASAHTDSWSAGDTRRLLAAVRALPCGVLAMSRELPGLVETSSSVGVVETSDDALTATCLTRTANEPALAGVVGAMESIALLAGGELEIVSSYPGWRPDPETPAVVAASAAFRRVYGTEPPLTGVHAGLECAAIGAKIPEMSMVSFGPTIRGPHAPGERMQISTVARFWELLVATLDELSDN